MDNELSNWSAGLIHLDENNKLSVNFDYAPWLESDFGPNARTSFSNINTWASNLTTKKN